MQTSFSKAQADHKQLLFNVKSTVEHLLLNNKTTSTKLDGLSIMQNADEVALLHSAVEQIFVHGIRLFKSDVIKPNLIFICLVDKNSFDFSYHPTCGPLLKDLTG